MRCVSRTALALLIAVVGTAGYTQHRAAERRDDTARTCLAAATPAAQAIFSYDYRAFDDSVRAARSFVTGTFATDYLSTIATLRSTVLRERAMVQARVAAAGLVEADNGSASVLVFLDQYRRDANSAGERVDQDRFVLTMVLAGGACKVSEAAAI